MLAGLLTLEMLSIGLFAAILTRQQQNRVVVRARYWLNYESTALASQVAEALEKQSTGWIGIAVGTIGQSPNISLAKVTDPEGNVLYVNKGDAGRAALDPDEKAAIPLLGREESKILTLPGNRWEGVRAIVADGRIRGYAWVEFDKSAAGEQLAAIQRDTLVFAIIWAAASALLVPAISLAAVTSMLPPAVLE